MDIFSPFCSIECSSDKVLQWTQKQLLKAGLRVVQTFDLCAVRVASPNCSCPVHGTIKCKCQMVILMIYGDAPEPVTLIFYGKDGKTWLSLVDTPNQRADIRIKSIIQQTFDVKIPVFV